MTTDTPDARALVERLLWLEAQYRSAGRFLAEDFKEASATITALLDRIEALEAERDTAWNDAIEAAHRMAALNAHDCHICQDAVDAILALHKGDLT